LEARGFRAAPRILHWRATDVTPGTAWQFRVRAVSDAGASMFSAPSLPVRGLAAPPLPPPVPPVQVSRLDTTMLIRWTPGRNNGSRIAGYCVEMAETASSRVVPLPGAAHKPSKSRPSRSTRTPSHDADADADAVPGTPALLRFYSEFVDGTANDDSGDGGSVRMADREFASYVAANRFR